MRFGRARIKQCLGLTYSEKMDGTLVGHDSRLTHESTAPWLLARVSFLPVLNLRHFYLGIALPFRVTKPKQSTFSRCIWIGVLAGRI